MECFQNKLCQAGSHIGAHCKRNEQLYPKCVHRANAICTHIYFYLMTPTQLTSVLTNTLPHVM